MFPDSLSKGRDGSELCVFISDETHYSILMAANVMGLGYDNVIKIKTDEYGAMLIDELENAIQGVKDKGKIPLSVIGTAGSTVRGSFDPMREIASVCKKENMWFHIDAAWGGGCLFSDKHRVLMDGAELADSIAWDMHKMMGMPLICSAFLVKDLNMLKTVCQHGQ